MNVKSQRDKQGGAKSGADTAPAVECGNPGGQDVPARVQPGGRINTACKG